MKDKYLLSRGGGDYIGAQCYTKVTLGPSGIVGDPEGETTDMGSRFSPECVEYTVKRAAAIRGLPVIVTENGIATADDAQRIRYLEGALQGLRHLLDEGVDVRRYFQWSLLDTF